jgi:hypothetical protein
MFSPGMITSSYLQYVDHFQVNVMKFLVSYKNVSDAYDYLEGAMPLTFLHIFKEH